MRAKLNLLCALVIGSLTQANAPAQGVKAYVPNEAANTVSIIDVNTNAVVATVSGGASGRVDWPLPRIIDSCIRRMPTLVMYP